MLAIGTLPMLLLDVRRGELHHRDVALIDTINIVVLVAFAVDYIVEIVLAGDRARFVRSEWPSLLIVISQAMALVPGLGAFGVCAQHAAHAACDSCSSLRA